MTEDLPTTWDSLFVGARVRWVTPRFVKRGVVFDKGKESLQILFDFNDMLTTIPLARWYVDEGRENEHIVMISTPRPPVRPLASTEILLDEITPLEAASIMGVESKQVRRMIRNKQLHGRRVGGRWLLSRAEVQENRR